MDTKLFNTISASWVVGDLVENIAKELNVSEAEVRVVYEKLDADLENYFAQERNDEVSAPEDEDYYEITRN